MTDNLTKDQRLALEELYCRPHRFESRAAGVNAGLVDLGLMAEHAGAGVHPLTWKGRKTCHALIEAGKWPPSSETK